MWRWLINTTLLALAVLVIALCQGTGRDEESNGSDGGSDTDGDTDADSDADSDTDGDPDVKSFIWIANTGEGTLSKVNTVTAVEEARYITAPYGTANDPLRTSVNRHGDMVVTNRNPNLTAASSVTKFAADQDDCIDRNDNSVIETSTGPGDVKPWLEDECMIWNTEIGPPAGGRPTAWDGNEDPDTGQGGHVWVATCSWASLPTRSTSSTETPGQSWPRGLRREVARTAAPWTAMAASGT